MNYYRDIWTLGPSMTKYPGAFPNGFVSRVKRKWWGKKRCWLFSGMFRDENGTTVDIKPECNPSVVADCESLPFEDDAFDFVLADPPYSELEASELYGTVYPSIVRVLNEAARITAGGG